MSNSVPFQKLENTAGPTVWEIHLRIDGNFVPVRRSGVEAYRYESLTDALKYARLCYDADRTSVLVVEVESND